MKKYQREVVLGFGVLWDPKLEAERRAAEEEVGAQPQPGSSRDQNGPSKSLQESQSPNKSSTTEASDGPRELGPIARKVYKFETVHTCSPGPLAEVPPDPDPTADNPLGPADSNGKLPPGEVASPTTATGDPDSAAGSRRRHFSKVTNSSPKEEANEGAKRRRITGVAMAHTAAPPPPPPIDSSVGLATEFTGTKTCIPETTGTHTLPWLALETAAGGSNNDNDNNGNRNNRAFSSPPILPIPQIPGMEPMEEVADEPKEAVESDKK